MIRDWKPHHQQELFLKRGEFEVLYGGAAGGGKSDALIMAALRGVNHPKYHGLLLRRTFPQLQEIIDRSHDYYPSTHGIYSATKKRWEWPSGAKISFGHMQNEQDKENYQGKEYQFIGVDELTHFTESQILYLHSRVRRSDDQLGLVFRYTTNPGGIGHVWVKKRFIDVATPYQTYFDPITSQSRAFIPATVYDNPSIMDSDPLYVKRLEALPEIEKRRLLYGEWDVFEGQVFTELSDAINGCDAFDIPVDWERVMAFDWGFSRPWCALWFAVDYDGTMYLYRELYGMKQGNPDKGLRMNNVEICRAILQAEQSDHIGIRVADPACWGPTKVGGSNQILGPSFAEDAMSEGLFFLKADNDRIRGKQQVHLRFMIDRETNADGEIIEESPRFLAFRSCKRWWEELQGLREDVKNPEDVDTEQPDEGYDCTRYAFMSRPVAPKYKPHEAPGSFQAERRRLIRAKQYALRHGTSLATAYGRIH